MNRACLTSCALLFLLAPAIAAQSGQETLSDVSTYDRWSRGQSVFAVAVARQKLTTPFFSPESLKRSLPNLYPALIRADWCQEREKQRGVVVLTNGDVVFWHSCAAGLIAFEGDQYPGTFGFKEE